MNALRYLGRPESRNILLEKVATWVQIPNRVHFLKITSNTFSLTWSHLNFHIIATYKQPITVIEVAPARIKASTTVCPAKPMKPARLTCCQLPSAQIDRSKKRAMTMLCVHAHAGGDSFSESNYATVEGRSLGSLMASRSHAQQNLARTTFIDRVVEYHKKERPVAACLRN